jgi:hypothetical protein
MSFSSNGTSSLCSKEEDEVVRSSLIRCVCNLPINNNKVVAPNSSFCNLQNFKHFFLSKCTTLREREGEREREREREREEEEEEEKI